MLSHRKKLRIWLIVMFASAIACSASGEDPADAGLSLSPTVNLTLTAVFSDIDSPEETEPIVVTSTGASPTEIDATEDSADDSPTEIVPTPTVPTLTAIVPTRPYSDPPTNPTLTPHPSGGPTTHGGPSVSALYVSPSPIIDGNYSDWTRVSYPISSVVYGSGYYLDEDDISGSFQVGWDATHLFIGIEVIDNKFVQISSGQYLYLGDSIEILFDTDVSGDFEDASLSFDDHQLGISPGSPATGQLPEAYIWYPSSKRGATSVVEMAVVMTSTGYKIEAAIPFSLFGAFAAPEQHFGFAISISDNDTLGAQWQQTMVSNVATRKLSNPLTWGDIVLTVP